MTFEPIHPADAASPDQLMEGQRLVRTLFPEVAQQQDARKCVGVCGAVKAPKEIATWSPAGQREWRISGMCEPCFDAAFAESPLLRATLVAEFRTPEALAADRASTPETYGSACYLGGGAFSNPGPAPQSFDLIHVSLGGEEEVSAESACAACWEKLLYSLVSRSLDAATENGYEFTDQDPGAVAVDLYQFDGALDCVPPAMLEPAVTLCLERLRRPPTEGDSR